MERHLRMFAKLGLRSTDLLLNTEMHAMLPATEMLEKCYKTFRQISQKYQGNIIAVEDRDACNVAGKCHRNTTERFVEIPDTK